MASGTDTAIAVGTIAAAVAAVIGLLISLYINSKDRQRADEQALNDRRAAADLAAQDRAAIREDAQRRHIVDLLLELGSQVGEQQAYSGGPQSAAAAQRITLLLNALPAESAYTVRQKFNCIRTSKWAGGVGQKLNYLDLNNVGSNADTTQMSREIAYDINRYLTSGFPPDAVWADMDHQAEWQREHWPR